MTSGAIPGLSGFAYGVLAALAFRRLTDAKRVRLTVNRMLAHVMEFRLFVDEPALIWRAQRAALRANLDLLRQIAIPTVIMMAAFALIRVPMNRYFGHGPLRAGVAAVVTASFDRAPSVAGVVVETPGVRVRRTGEVSWRVRPVRDVDAFPRGYNVGYPRTETWLWWFLGCSVAGAFIPGANRMLRTSAT